MRQNASLLQHDVRRILSVVLLSYKSLTLIIGKLPVNYHVCRRPQYFFSFGFQSLVCGNTKKIPEFRRYPIICIPEFLHLIKAPGQLMLLENEAPRHALLEIVGSNNLSCFYTVLTSLNHTTHAQYK